MKLAVLGSGSKGNCSYIEIGGKKILVDVGYSVKKIREKLSTIDQNLEDIDAIFITHDHGDHMKSVSTLSRRQNIPIYIHKESLRQIQRKLGNVNTDNIVVLEDRKVFLDNVLVENFDVMHDSKHNLGYTFNYQNEKLSYVTDIGKITNIVRQNCMNSDYIAFESNYDLGMLLNGRYSWDLKNRVKSNVGHISNDEASTFLENISNNRLKEIFLLHLSEENNTPNIAYKTLEEKIDKRIKINITGQVATKLFDFKK
ncbi:MBL fold metallo-hydrolase [uncultured Sneathia sp.]|uniref:MBL fold metallo-hydrolase n=1 Tax=uncultured Sneathia sp. TaxID=278067 RepID=UPI0025930BCE|nr:MBL fold metallo-hydrolase [uncultured Sneathia sp.]